MNVQLLIIDPQNDFCDGFYGTLSNKDGSMAADMDNLAEMINRVGDKINDIHVTLDSHRTVDIAHPIFWIDKEGKHPNPFTIISVKDVEDGVWTPTRKEWLNKFPGKAYGALDYVKTLEANGRYPLCIWPEHCIIGSWGHGIWNDLSEALCEWEHENFGIVDYITKGSNIFTEHYSAIKADVIDPSDPSTLLNQKLIDAFKSADVVAIAGQALSHCVANSILDIMDNFDDSEIKKLVLLEDATSNVSGFENLGEEFLEKATARGLQISNTEKFLL